MASKKKGSQRARAQTREKTVFNIFVKLFTGEKFPLKSISNDMKIRELKMYMEFATGVPVHMQRISYLDDGELLDHTDIRSNDIVPGATLQMKVWPMWKELIEACASNDTDWVFRLGVTQPTSYHTPGSDYMTKRARKAWLQERAFLALFIAAHRGHEPLVRHLIEAGADVNATTMLGRSPLHVAASQGHGHIVDLLLEKGADIDAEDEAGQTALTIAAKFGHKTCERHLFLFRWQERAKKTRPSAEPPRMAHQYFDSAFPVWKKGGKCQLYFTNILPPGEYEGTRFGSPKKQTELDEEDIDLLENIGRDGKLPAIAEGRRFRAQSAPEDLEVQLEQRPRPRHETRSGPARLSKRGGVSYNDWLGRKQSAEQKLLDVKKAEEEKKKLEEDERKRQEAEKSESYETWLANKETEKKATTTQPPPQRLAEPVPLEKIPEQKSEGYLRSYLRSLDDRRRGMSYFCYENWLDEKEESVLGVPNSRRQKTFVTV